MIARAAVTAGAVFAVIASAALAKDRAIVSAPLPLPLDLHLQCIGEGTYAGAKGGPVHVRVASFTESPLDDQMLVDVLGERGKIHVPRRMTPAVHGADADGWRPISGLSVSDREIRGRVSLGPRDTPSVTIDRRNGHIEVSGPGNFAFRGDCQAFDPNAGRKF